MLKKFLRNGEEMLKKSLKSVERILKIFGVIFFNDVRSNFVKFRGSFKEIEKLQKKFRLLKCWRNKRASGIVNLYNFFFLI